MKKFLLLLILIIGIALIAGTLSRLSSKSSYTALVTDDNAVLLVDQKDSDTVTVSYAKLAQPGYVLLYGADATTGQQLVLGTSIFLAPGEYTNIRIHRGSNSNSKKITAVVVQDDGDGVFEEGQDTALTLEDGSTVDSEAVVSDTGADVGTLTEEEITTLLDEEGYDISPTVEEDRESSDEAMSEGDVSAEESEQIEATDDTTATTTDDGQLMEETATTSDDGMSDGAY